jgi:hypothetical protein
MRGPLLSINPAAYRVVDSYPCLGYGQFASGDSTPGVERAMTYLKKFSVWLSLLLFGAILALAASVTCPIDDLTATFTGQTHWESGDMFQQYRCPRAHVFWVRVN